MERCNLEEEKPMQFLRSSPLRKRARFLCTENDKTMEEDDLRLPLFSYGNKRKIGESSADELARLREENRMLRENISMLGDLKVQASRFHQTHNLHNGELNSTSKRKSLGFPQLCPAAPLTSSSSSSQKKPAQEVAMVKFHVSLKTRADDPMTRDGCRWRRYEQKMIKGNPYPRDYYRCSMGGNCPVKKKVQKCAEGQSILLTTYSGQHNHPLPPAAMVMAKIIKSALSILLPGSSSTWERMPRDVASFFSRANMCISSSAHSSTVVVDTTNPASSSGSPDQRDLEIVQADPAAMAPQADERMIATLTSHQTFQSGITAAVESVLPTLQNPKTSSG